MSADNVCMKCSGTSFRRVTDSWMHRSIPWTADGIVRQCERCGEKHFVCPNCRGLLTRVNITNVRAMQAECPQCGHQHESIRTWLAEQRG